MSATDGISSRELSRRAGRVHQSEPSVVACVTIDSTFARCRGRSNYAKLLHPVDQRRSFHPELLGSAIPTPYHPVARFKRMENMVSLHLRKTTHGLILLLVRAELFQLG